MATKAKTAGKSKSGQRKAPDNKTGTESSRSKKSVADHSEHPENSSDSTVRHADQPARRTGPAGSKGFPQGEYDVTKPRPAGGRKQSIEQQLLEAHHGDSDLEAIKKANARPSANRLHPTDRALAIETLPVGSTLEHEQENRWRVVGRLGGGNRYGHGSTAQEAIDNYVLGSSVGDSAQAAAQAFHELPKRQQKEITERDEKAARRLGQDPSNTAEAIARQEFVDNQKAARSAAHPAPNATSDGAEVASAQLEAGARRGGTETATRNRTGARQRTGSTSRKGSKK